MKQKNSLLKSIINGIGLIISGRAEEFYREFKKRFRSTTLSLGLRRNLNTPFVSPDAKIPINVRKFQPGDYKSLFGDEEFAKSNLKLITYQRQIIDANINTCYVATDQNNTAGYMQWLIGPEHNDDIQSVFKGIFPVLKDNEALLEAAFMSPAFRGLRIMPAAMSRITEKADNLGVTWVITFVGIENIPSLKGCHRAGFSPYILRKDSWDMFRQKVTYHPIPAEILEEYEANIGISHEPKRMHNSTPIRAANNLNA